MSTTKISDILPEEMLQRFKNQFIIVLVKKLQNEKGELVIPCAELDDTGQDVLYFNIDEDRNFIFKLRKKS